MEPFLPHLPAPRLLVASLGLLALAVAFPGAGSAQNLVQNGDFDTNISGWGASSGSISHDSGEGSTSGPGSLTNFTNSSQSSARQCVGGIVGGGTYDFGADFRVDTGGPLNFCRVQLDEYDSPDCSGLSTSQLASVQQTFVNNSTTYTTLASTYTFEATTASVRVRLDCDKNTPSHRVNWDDAFLTTEPVESTRYTLVAGQGATLYHLPGANGLLGDGDDVAKADPTALIGSDPNYRGSYSYLVGELPGGGGEPGLPGSFNGISFLEGTVDFAPGSGIVGSNIVHTGHRQGYGQQQLLQLTPDVIGSVSGTFLTLDAPFAPTGDAYVDTVLIPKATQLGAEGLLFVDATGTIPANPPLSFPVPLRMVVFGVRGVPGVPVSPAPGGSPERGSGMTDLNVTKTTDVSGQQAPGTTVTYALTVTNAGPAVADGVLLRDRIPFETNFLSNDCGAPPPVGRVLSWAVGSLASGANATCQVTIQVLLGSNFDFHNAAIAYGNQWDPNLDDNVGESRVEVLDGASLGVEQVPNQGTGFSSDLDCDACGTGAQGIADSFKVDSLAQICGLTFYGGYNDNTPFPDQLRIEIYDENRQTPGVPGVPGQLVATLTGAGFQTRFATGQQIASQFDEYRYRVAILQGQGPVLPRGRYWLLILNDSSGAGGNGDWFWESGDVDVLGRTVPGIAFSTTINFSGLGWGPSPTLATAFELCLAPFDNTVFTDGFESGDTSAWTSVVQ